MCYPKSLKSIDRFSIETRGDLGIHFKKPPNGDYGVHQKKTSMIMVSIVIMGSYGL